MYLRTFFFITFITTIISFHLNSNNHVKTISNKHPNVLSMNFKNELGVQPPLGFWDPLGLLNDADQIRFDRLRTVEIKHGRIAMLAVLGIYIIKTIGRSIKIFIHVFIYILIYLLGHITTTAGYHLPGEIAFGIPFASIDDGLAGLYGPHAVPQVVYYHIIVIIVIYDMNMNVLSCL